MPFVESPGLWATHMAGNLAQVVICLASMILQDVYLDPSSKHPAVIAVTATGWITFVLGLINAAVFTDAYAHWAVRTTKRSIITQIILAGLGMGSGIALGAQQIQAKCPTMLNASGPGGKDEDGICQGSPIVPAFTGTVGALWLMLFFVQLAVRPKERREIEALRNTRSRR